ncbi:MAG: YbjQ family protein [Opitutales bacterium]|nr:YbjQ family protein [Opitutales bacterium]
MIIVTCDEIPGKKIVKTYGFVRGSTTRAKHVGKDILASFRNLVGGEVHEYTKLLAEAREHAIDRMRDEAKKLGANAVVATRFASSEISAGVAEILVYGTAVTIE